MQRCICQPDDRQTLRIRPLRTDLVGRSSLRSSQPGTRAPSRSGFVITVLLSAAPGSSPFRRIPETIDSLPHPSEECKQFVKHAQNFRVRRRFIFPAEIHILNYANMGSGVSAHGHGSTRMRSRGISSRQQRHRPRRRQTVRCLQIDRPYRSNKLERLIWAIQ